MRGLLTILAALLLGFGLPASSPAITHVLGGQMACDPALPSCTPIPLTVTTLCTASCPKISSFSYSSTARFWGSTGAVGGCRVSVNGGTTWAACATQPFTTGSTEFYAGASDGSVIAVGTPTGPSTCTIRRSTDNATSWTTVYTNVVVCSNSGNEGQYLYCLGDGRCEYIAHDGVTDTNRIIRSSDNGQNWVTGETSVQAIAVAGAAWNGSGGILTVQTGTNKSWSAIGDSWVLSTFVWNGTPGQCWGSVIYNSAGRMICNNGTTGYKMYDSEQNVVASLTLPGSATAAGNGGTAISIRTNNLYVFAQGVSPSSMAVWASIDNLSTFTRLGDISGGGAGMRGGNVFFTNGCVYFSVGLTPMFGKIC